MTAEKKRRLRNYLLEPDLQLSIGLLSAFISLFFASIVATMVYLNLHGFYKIVIELTALGPEIQKSLGNYIITLGIWVAAAVVIYVLVNLGVNIHLTHRMVGPIYAFRRHIEELRKGNFESRVQLRKNDAFKDLADELNELAVYMAKVIPVEQTSNLKTR